MRKQPKAPTPVSASAANAAGVSIVAGIFFVLLLGTLHFLEPEFDPTWRFVSEYQLGRFGWMMHLAFFALATSLAGAGVALWSQARNWVGHLGNVGLFIAALGMGLAGIFITDPIATGNTAMTLSGNMHVLGASLDYTPIAALLLSVSLARLSAWRPIRRQMLATAIVSSILMLAFIVALPRDGHFGPGVYAGLLGRFLLVSYVGWILTVGIHALKLRGAEASTLGHRKPVVAVGTRGQLRALIRR